MLVTCSRLEWTAEKLFYHEALEINCLMSVMLGQTILKHCPTAKVGPFHCPQPAPKPNAMHPRSFIHNDCFCSLLINLHTVFSMLLFPAYSPSSLLHLYNKTAAWSAGQECIPSQKVQSHFSRTCSTKFSPCKSLKGHTLISGCIEAKNRFFSDL